MGFWSVAAPIAGSILGGIMNRGNRPQAPPPSAEYNWQQKNVPGMLDRLSGEANKLMTSPYGLGDVKQRLHLFWREHPGKAFPPMRCFQQSRRIFREPTVRIQETEEDAQRRQVPRDGGRLHRSLSGEIANMVRNMMRRDRSRFIHAQLTQVASEVAQVAPVRIKSGHGQAGLDAQVRQKVTYRCVEGRVWGGGAAGRRGPRESGW